MSKTANTILKTATTVVVILVLVLAFLLVGVRLFGLQVFTVLSGSMEPEYLTGSLIYVKSVEPEELQVGDVITFSLSEQTTATHRIIEILPDENNPDALCFRTKGDANKFEDAGLVLEANVIGKPVFTIPYLGYLAAFIQQPPGMYLAIAIGLIVVILVFMVDMITDDKEGKHSKDPSDPAQDQMNIKENDA